jgi:hypothetical protein
MFPLIRNAWQAMWFDEAAVVRWLRVGVGSLAVSGALYADQLEPFVGHRWAQVMRLAAIIATIVTAAHG